MDLASIRTMASNSKVKPLSVLAREPPRGGCRSAHTPRGGCGRGEKLVLEKVQVPPGERVRVVGLAGGRANRAGEDAAPREVQMDIQTSGRLVKVQRLTSHGGSSPRAA